MHNFCFVVLLSGLLWAMPFAAYGQSPDLVRKIPPEVLEQISPDQQKAIQSRAEELILDGKSEEEIAKQLQEEGLIPEAIQGEGGTEPKSNIAPDTPVDPDILPPQSVDAPAAEREEEPEVIQPVREQVAAPRGNQIFGHHIFDNAVQFNKAISSAPSFDYVIAPGDVFAVNVWGCSEFSTTLTVGPDGSVRAQYLGKVVLEGLTYGRARDILIARYRNIVSKCSELEVFIGSSQRSISVNIFGEVKQAGSYKINAATPAFNALFEAGGVTPIGSVRKIEIRRNGEVAKVIDLYDILIDGELDPVYLQDNDVLFVGIQEKIVAINGPVKRPMKYELLEGENLAELIDYAGGLKPQALRSSARMIRPDEERPVQIDFVLSTYLKDDGAVYPLEGGDLIQIRAKKTETENTVGVIGPVAFPDDYQLKKGDRVSELIQQAGGLEEEAFLPRAYVIRTDPTTAYLSYIPISLVDLDNPENNIVLQYNDRLQVFSEKNFQETRDIEISGQVNNPGSVRLSREMTFKDLLYQAGGLIEGVYIQEVELYRQFNPLERGINNLGSGEDEIIRLGIPRDWQSSTIADSLKMWEFRKVVIRSEDEFVRKGEIIVNGLVSRPGKYEVLPNMSLRDLFYLAGGFKIEADYGNIELSRVVETIGENNEIIPVPIVIQRISTSQDWRDDESLDEIKINAFDQIFVRPNPDFLLQENVSISGEVRVAGVYNKISKNERLSSLVSRSGGITELAYLKGAVLQRKGVGTISIQLEQALRNPGSKWDIAIQEGDQLMIPARLDVVTIQGNVLESGVKVVYEPGIRSLRYYVRQAGGFDRKTDKKQVKVEYVNGRVRSARRFLWVSFYPKVEQGSEISVPEKPEKEKKEKREDREPLDLQQIFSGITAALTVILLVDRTFQ